MEKQRFVVVIEQDEDGMYVASVPALPGCHTQAPTLAALEERIREAIELCLMVEKDIQVPAFIGVHQIEVQE